MALVECAGRSRRASEISPFRVAAVTVGLAGAGALLGGLSGALALAVAMSLRMDWRWIAGPVALLFAGIVGAVIGGVCAPVASWVLLREVPLGRAMLRTTLAAAAAGAVSGALFPERIDVPVWGALLGLVVEAARLYLTAPHRRQRPSAAPGSSTRW